MSHEPFLKEFHKARAELRKMNVAAIEINCPLELHAFELYCAMELNTTPLNTFKTH